MSRKYKILAVVALLVLVLDQYTKNLVLQHFHLGESISIISNYFNLTYIQNTGAAFGLLAQAPAPFRVPFFLIVPLIALAVIVFIFRKLPSDSIKLPIALSLIMSGALGNLIDRIRFGYVVDFLDFHWKYQIHYPAFNVADSAICVGVGIMMLDLVYPAGEEESSQQNQRSASSRNG